MKNLFDAITGLRYDASAEGNIYTAFVYIYSKALKSAKLNALHTFCCFIHAFLLK